MNPWLVGGAAALAGGLLGGQSADVELTPEQIAAGRMMRQISKTPLEYVGTGPLTNSAFGSAAALGNVNISPALRYANSLLAGDFMGSNPYLDDTFDRAAGATRNALDSQFAKAGRYGSDAHANVMADQYNDLATNIYGGAYDTERAYMNQAATMLPAIYGQGISNAQGLLGIGSAQDQAEDERINWDVYDPYKRLSMMQVGQGMMPQPTYQNTGAGALGGALAGLQLFSGIKGLV